MADFVSDPLAGPPVKAASLAEFEALAGEVFRRSAEKIPRSVRQNPSHRGRYSIYHRLARSYLAGLALVAVVTKDPN